MSEIKSYSLWLERISTNSTKAQQPGGIPIVEFGLSDSRHSGISNGSGAGPGKARFDTLAVVAVDRNLALAQLDHARTSGANLGRGRIDAVLTSGSSRLLLDFESAVVETLSISDRGSRAAPEFQLQLMIHKPRVLWQPITR